MENIYTSITTYEKIRSFIGHSMANNKSFAAWSLPDEELVHIIISDDAVPLEGDFQFEEMKEGFIFTSFDKNKSYYLNASTYWNSGNDALDIDHNPTEQLQYYSGNSEPKSINSEHYLELVESSIDKISEGYFEKVVPARIKCTEVNKTFDPIQFFLTLKDQYPDAFTSFVSIPDVGTWIGASPEILIHVKDHIFKTVSLAGTQPYETSRSIRDTSWTQKEIEEQALVSRYIINCFKKIRLREFDEFGPKTVRAGNLLHLKTEFKVDMKATNYPDLGSIMLKLLHPTSAVCGMPVENAKNFLKENEGFSREFFAGYLGPVNINQTTNIFVNLRCLQLIKDQAILYAGAGVTADSEPVKELNETEIKMNTLIRMLK